MNRHLKKNTIKKFASLVGVASVSAFFSFPAFAIINPTSNQSHAVVNSGNELLAQNRPGSDTSPTPRTNSDDRAMPVGGQNPGTRQAPAPVPTNANTPETVPSLPPEKTTTGNKPGPAGDTSLQRGSWLCLNNPNPQCAG